MSMFNEAEVCSVSMCLFMLETVERFRKDQFASCTNLLMDKAYIVIRASCSQKIAARPTLAASSLSIAAT